MAFFDDLGAKLTSAGQKTMKKANDLTDSAKLTMRTNELNRAVQELYTKLGEQYYTLYGKQPAEGLEDLCREIAENQEEIQKLRMEIQRIKQIKVCPSCGSENPSDANFCSKCSAALPEFPKPAPAPTGRTCPSCGSSVGETALFCTKCGTKLAPASQPEAVDTESSEPL